MQGIPQEALALLRQIATSLESLLSCIFESLYPASESAAFLNLLETLPDCNEVARLIGLVVCIRSPQAFTSADSTKLVLTSCIPLSMDMLARCAQDIPYEDGTLEAIYQGLVASLESAVASSSLPGCQFFVDGVLLRSVLHQHALPSAIAFRLWVHVVSRGDSAFRKRAVDMLVTMVCSTLAPFPFFLSFAFSVGNNSSSK